MARYVKYRGAGAVPIVSAKMKPGQAGKKDPLMSIMPRKDWRNPGEKLPITRHRSNIHTKPGTIPARKKK